MLKNILKDDSGGTAIEYGLIAAGIAVIVIVSISLISTQNEITNTNGDTDSEILHQRELSQYQKRLTYFYDGRTKLCFASYKSSFTSVPCSIEVKGLTK